MYCKHGTYVGTPHGADHMCGYCEDGREPEDFDGMTDEALGALLEAYPAGAIEAKAIQQELDRRADDGHTPTGQLTRAQLDSLYDRAYRAGFEHGQAVASWYFDGNTPRETYRRVLAGIEDCDPEVFDTFPTSPLSGEWAGDITCHEVLDELGVSDEDEASHELLVQYEDGFDVGVAQSIETTCLAQLGLRRV